MSLQIYTDHMIISCFEPIDKNRITIYGALEIQHAPIEIRFIGINSSCNKKKTRVNVDGNGESAYSILVSISYLSIYLSILFCSFISIYLSIYHLT